MWKVLLADETELQVKYCGEDSNILWMEVYGLTIPEAVSIFTDKTKTSKIIAYENVVHEGYTNLIHVSVREGTIAVALKKEAA